jgi:hypothetical protein
MKFIKNIADILDPMWLEEILSKDGMHRPRDGKKPTGAVEENEYNKARAAGYKDDATYFQMFDKTNCTFDIPDWHTCGRKKHWWIIKMMPGDFMPMHIDPHSVDDKNVARYWVSLKDWEIGHIFAYEDHVITNYKAGDLWEYSNPTAIHGAANIGLTPRVVLQVSLYNE